MVAHALRVLFLIFALLPAARAASLALVLSDNGGPYAEFSNGLGDALDGSSWRITSSGKADTLIDGRPDLIVAVGGEAFRQMLARNGSSPILATLIPRQTYEKLLAEAGRQRPKTSAIFLEQPAARQAAFIRHLLPGQKRVGLLQRSESRQALAIYLQALDAAGFKTDTEESEHDGTLLPALNALLPRVNLLLATPDPGIYKRDNIKAILVTTYRHRRPVIAFSPAFVNAGALAALYSSPAQIARQTAELLFSHGSNLPAPREPSQFAIAINRNVAQTLDIELPDESVLRRALLNEKEGR